MENVLAAAVLALAPMAILATGFGVLIGIFFGSIPGLTFTVALALALPITFHLEPVAAIGLLLGTYIGGMTGGSVSAILLGIPGTPSAAATVLDGYPMAKRGQASLALGTAVIVSVFGGVFSLLVMIGLVGVVARAAISFGPAEIFALVFFGLSTICGLSGKSLLKGLIAGTIGLLIMTIGLDNIDGVQRMTMGSVNMLQGVNLLVALIGLFAVPFIVEVFDDHRRGAGETARATSVSAQLPSFRLLYSNLGLMIRAALIGTGIGAIPGLGGPIAAFLAYDNAKRFSKEPQRFGKGAIAGVIAPETANNAVTGGAMIPLLALGIPGDPATAIVLAGLQIHGVVPGPALFMGSNTIVYGIYITIFVAYAFTLILQLVGIRLFVNILRVPPQLMAVIILVLCVVGAFSIRNSVFDVYMMAVVGLGAYVLGRAEIPLTPIILGMVLGPTLEGEFRTAMTLSGGSFDIFYQSPMALTFFGLAALLILLQATGGLFKKRRAANIEKNNA